MIITGQVSNVVTLESGIRRYPVHICTALLSIVMTEVSGKFLHSQGEYRIA
jgi:hypothetical protein